MISSTQSNNTPSALRNYRENDERAFPRPCEVTRPCERCDGSGHTYWRDITATSMADWRVCPRCHGTGREPEAANA